MPSVPVTDLLTRVRDITDMNDDQFIEDEVLLRWLNAAVPRLDQIILRAGWVINYIGASFETNTGGSDGTEGYDIGEQAAAIIAVYEAVSSTEVRMLRATSAADKAVALPGTRATHFFVSNDTDTGNTVISLRPNPGGQATYAVYYIPASPTLVTGTPSAGEADEVLYPSGWEEWLVLEVARQVNAREESMNPLIEDRKRELEKDIERMASDRVFAQGPKVRNVDRVERDNWTISSALMSPDTWTWL